MATNPRWEGVMPPYQASDVEKLRAPGDHPAAQWKSGWKFLGNVVFNPICALTGSRVWHRWRASGNLSAGAQYHGRSRGGRQQAGDGDSGVDRSATSLAPKKSASIVSMLQDLEVGHRWNWKPSWAQTDRDRGICRRNDAAYTPFTPARNYGKKFPRHKDERPSAQTTEHRLPVLGDNEA